MLTTVVIGAGHIGQRHIRSIDKITGWQLIAVVDPEYATEDTPCYTSIHDYLEHTDPASRADVAVIATPNHLHPAQAHACLQAGMRVIIEKPIAIDQHGVDIWSRLAEDHSRNVCCVMQLRYSPLVKRLKALLEQGSLGRIHQVDVQMYWNRDDRYYGTPDHPHPWRGVRAKDGGALYTQFAHFIDLIYLLFGSWEVHHAWLHNVAHPHLDIEDTGHVAFTIDDIIGSMKYTTACYDNNYMSTITILGDRGTIVVGGQYFDQLIYAHPDLVHAAYNSLMISELNPTLSGHDQLYAELYDVWHGGVGPVPHDLSQGLDVIKMIEGVYAMNQVKR